MANTSATGGVLQPAATVAYGDALDAIFQTFVVGLGTLTGDKVRPRWQATMPDQPEASVDWCAIGVTEIDAAEPSIEHDPTNNGSDTFIRHETIRVLASYYGPDSMANAMLMRDNVRIPQNVESLAQYEIGFVTSDNVTPMPELINAQWVKRYDLPLIFRRKVTMVYAVETILTAGIDLYTDPDTGITKITN